MCTVRDLEFKYTDGDVSVGVGGQHGRTCGNTTQGIFRGKAPKLVAPSRSASAFQHLPRRRVIRVFSSGRDGRHSTLKTCLVFIGSGSKLLTYPIRASTLFPSASRITTCAWPADSRGAGPPTLSAEEGPPHDAPGGRDAELRVLHPTHPRLPLRRPRQSQVKPSTCDRGFVYCSF